MDGSNMMRPAKERPILNGVVSVGKWMRSEFAEWFVGSWALIIGWVIFTTIFFNFLLMDGIFSRGLGEGSGVNPDRFQQVGWMYRLFAAAFLMLATKLSLSGLGKHAWTVRIIGGFITLIVILHATGFGLKALEGKRGAATAIEEVAKVTDQANVDVLAQLRAQVAQIDADLKTAVAPINAEIFNLDTDRLAANDKRSDNLRERRTKLEDAALAEKAKLNASITTQITTGSTQKVTNTETVEKSEKWAPLFVGLGQLFTWNPQPTDWAIYVCAVLFLIFWVLVGDAIAIALPDALYRMHLQDAKNRKVNLSADAFADLLAQRDELQRRKANIDDGVDRALKTKTRKRNRAQTLKILEDQRAEAVKKDAAEQQAAEAEVKKIDDAIAELNGEDVEEEDAPEPLEEFEADEPEQVEDEQPELELTEQVDEPEADEAPEAPEPGTDLVPFVEASDEPEESDEESDDKRPLQAAE
jgi:hypothetical protein